MIDRRSGPVTSNARTNRMDNDVCVIARAYNGTVDESIVRGSGTEKIETTMQTDQPRQIGTRIRLVFFFERLGQRAANEVEFVLREADAVRLWVTAGSGFHAENLSKGSARS